MSNTLKHQIVKGQKQILNNRPDRVEATVILVLKPSDVCKHQILLLNVRYTKLEIPKHQKNLSKVRCSPNIRWFLLVLNIIQRGMFSKIMTFNSK